MKVRFSGKSVFEYGDEESTFTGEVLSGFMDGRTVTVRANESQADDLVHLISMVEYVDMEIPEERVQS